MNISTTNTSNTWVRKPFLLDEPGLEINPLHSLTLASTMQRYNNLGMLLDPTRSALFSYLPPELRIKIWKDAFAEWLKTQRRVRIVVPASPLVSNKVICDQLNDLYFPHPNLLSEGSGFATEVCPLLNVNFEAREIALREFAGSLEVCSCYQNQCYQCQDLGVELEELGARDCDCKEQCEEKCRGKAYFTADQIFYIPGFYTLSWQIEQIMNDDFVKQHYKIGNDNHPFDWTAKLQNVVLEAHQLMPVEGEVLKATLSKFTSLKKLILVWRFDPKNRWDPIFITQYANEDNDNNKEITHEMKLDCLKQANVKSPELWLNQLPGVEMEMVFVPMELDGGNALSREKINEGLQGLEGYFTPGNYARKLEAERQDRIMKDISFEISLLRDRRREREEFQERKERAIILGEQKRDEFLSKLSFLDEPETDYEEWESNQPIKIGGLVQYITKET